MRFAFTIGLNCKHHLLHNDFYKKMLDMFDYWVFVEGASQNGGSTKWCKQMPGKWHDNGRSVDGTIGELYNIIDYNFNIGKHDFRVLFNHGEMWESKDAMVNEAIKEIKKKHDIGFLWQVDADEQWKLEDIEAAENWMENLGAKSGAFRPNHYVGKDLVACGDWGSVPFQRVWRWNGELFASHEPPTLEGMRKYDFLQLPQRFEHYSYYFEQDVKFKSEWYTGHQNVYKGWKKLQTETVFPQPISYLFGDTKYGKMDAEIVKLER